jgi:dipeptidyl aminopeptidase/acylaminoacyl peptidase
LTALPHGEWPSPIGAADVARGGVWLGFPTVVGDEVWWNETRPHEDGRSAVVRRASDGTTEDLLPAPWNARTRVHEYGGRAWLPVPRPGGATALVFASFADQRLHLLAPGSDPVPLTPAPDEPGALRYAAPVIGSAGEVLCIREVHDAGTVTRHVVAVPLAGSAAGDAAAVREVAGGSDFVAHPRLSPDGLRLAWVAWDHPRMPWDGTELRVADVVDGVATTPRTVLGGPTESVLQPEWAGDGRLYAVSDRSGWWNLYAVDLGSGATEPLCPREEEFGFPMWLLGFTSYAVLGDGRLAVLHGRGSYALGVLDPSTGELADLDLGGDLRAWRPYLSADGQAVAGLTAGPTDPPTVVRADVTTAGLVRVKASADSVPDPLHLPLPVTETLRGPGGREVHAHVHRPRNGDLTGPDGERAPYLVNVHGGPTAQSHADLQLEIAYFTSRGIGVVDVDYGGSSGYGRAYRERLRGQWGVVDVDDCVAAALALVERGDADGARLAIRGGSAGGWTTLSALTRTDVFAAGTSYFGVAELLRFAEDTHDFESRYLDGLVGPLPEARQVYVDRAPLSHVDGLSCPVLLLQGSDDEVVPPSQSLMFRDALVRKGIPHAYLEFEGEEHGFRKQSSVVASLEAELSFYGQVFGFDPPGVPRLELSTS